MARKSERPFSFRRMIRRWVLSVLLLLVVLGGLWVRFGLYGFLARTAPVESAYLVVEGWLPDESLLQAVAWAEEHHVQVVYVTGGPIAMGSWLSEWKTYAEMTAARLEELGAGTAFEVVAAPAPKVVKDRTRESAKALAPVLERGVVAFNVVSEGPHTRRSWRVFQEVFEGARVGSVAVKPEAYGAKDWWTCSEGVRGMLSEVFAYGYEVGAGKR